MTVLLVLAGGMIGAPARYLADRFVQARHDSVFPWGTLAINVAGSALLGFLLGAQQHLGLPAPVVGLLGTGFCGGLTTFSAFGYETMRLLADGALAEAGLNLLGSVAAAVLAAGLGFALGTVLLATPGRRAGPAPRRAAAVGSWLVPPVGREPGAVRGGGLRVPCRFREIDGESERICHRTVAVA